MPPVSKILLLPDAVREQLDERLRLSNFGDMVEHAAWLRSIGHDVGKSAVAVYSKRNRQRLLAAGPAWTTVKNSAAATIADQRIACLHAASLFAQEPAEAITLAERFLAWAYVV